ncbi:uncharacterized protein [Euwallacea fornicatus]|uniref:uncharacterized protein n=1 Tax=Euwallacea fornicatus TaxID=995702 RepID=UPI00338DDD53
MSQTCLFLFLSSLLVTATQGLKCYTCSATEDDSDTRCADDVESMDNAITDCDKKYCTINRVDYLDPKGKLASINRNCEDKVPADGITEDTTFRTYRRSCRKDLCNNGSGKGNNNDQINALGDKSLIYAPGTGRSSAITIYKQNVGLLSVLIIITKIIMW